VIDEKKMKKLLAIGARFRKEMQRLVDDNKSGITGITISSPRVNGGKETVIAEKKVCDISQH
jgi:hypothetical protein